jgi:hypothetical protein
MNVLLLTLDNTGACSFYRAGGIAKDLRKSGHDIIVAQWRDMILDWQTISNFDLIMMQRPYTKAALDLCTYIKRMNIPLWLDFDDNLLNIPPENKVYFTYNSEDVKESIKKMLALADAITVTTDDLKQSFSEFSKKITVIPNAFNDTFFRRSIIKRRESLIMWRGSDTHIYDLMSFGGAINKLTEEFTESQFLFLGYYPWFLKKTENKFFLAEMDVVIYFSDMYRMAPAVMQVPLVDDLFNRCKSNIAYIEASYFGAVSIIPEWWDVPGALKYKDVPSYYEAARQVLAGEVDIPEQNRIAWEYIMDTLRLSKINKMRVELINSLL